MPVSREPRLIHALPGRVRVHLSGWTPREHQGLSLRLRQAPGVRDVRANALTGNTLVLFDPGATDAHAIVMVMRAQWLRAPRVQGDGRVLVASDGTPGRARAGAAILPGGVPASARQVPAQGGARRPRGGGPPVPLVSADGSARRGAAPLSSTDRRQRFRDVLRAFRGLSDVVGLGTCIANLLRTGSVFGLIVNGLELFLLCGDVLARRAEPRRVTVLSSPGTDSASARRSPDRGDVRVSLSQSTPATSFTPML